MLHQRNKLFVILIGILLLASCNRYIKYDEKEISDIRKRVLNTSQGILGKNEYYAIYQMANDSINNWINHELGLWKYRGKTIDYQLDSIFCVNTKANKIFFAILEPDMPGEISVQDGISYFYGVKIRNTWYFFKGPGMVLLREWYQEDIRTPLSFEKLKQITTSNIYRHYLTKNKKGEWEINERLFADFTSAAWSSNWQTNTIEQWDSIYIDIINKQWEDHWKAEQKAKEDQRKAEIMEQYLNSLKK